MSSGQHLAAILPKIGAPLEVVSRPTPSPGPGELLIEVKAVAFNPIDFYQRDYGLPTISHIPAVLAADVGGVVVSAGPNVPADAPTPGSRILGLAPCFVTQGDPNYGALQQFVLIPADSVGKIPDDVSFVKAATIPLAATTGFSAWYSIGVARDTHFTPSEKMGILVWGGASSIGTLGIQIAKNMGYTVYTTASSKHHDYLKTLGAHKTFDYHDENCVADIIKAAKDEGIKLTTCYDCIMGQLSKCIDIVTAFKADGPLKIATAIPLERDGALTAEGVTIKFVAAPTVPEERDGHMRYIFQVLSSKLATGEIVPSPEPKVIPGGLSSANAALDELRAGVSGVKLVIEV